MKRRYPETSYYHVLAAYADVLTRWAKRQERADLFPHKLPPVTIGTAP